MIQHNPITLSTDCRGLGIVHVMDYFENVVAKYEQGTEPCLFLHSLDGLAQHLNCSAVEIQATLILLQKQGYDFFMMDMDTPVTFWHPDKLANLLASPA